MPMRTFFLSCCAVLPSFLFAQTHLDLISNYNVRPSGAYSAIWGYTAPDGREYAVLGIQGGGSSPGGTSIIDITDAENPTESAFISGPNSLWREMKTYSHYAYVVTESGGGVQIIDLSQLPESASLVKSFNFSMTGKNISSSHTISIHDGYMYLNGCAFWSPGGVVIFDLRADPENPVFVGTYEPAYIHDCYVLRDTIYGAAIYTGGGLFIADARDKTNILPIGKISYSGSGTHNSWVTKDRRYVITTDEIGTTSKTLKMWDISNLPSIPTSPAATYTSNPGVTEHNVTIRGDYAYVAWYEDGVQVVNVTDPAAPTGAGGFNQTGNLVWGVYPFFPSGKIIGGDMVTGLWTFSFSDLAPRVPVMLEEPADNDSVSTGSPVTFRWTKAADLNADPHYYEVHLTGPDVDTTWQADDSTTTFTDVGRLMPGSSYFWNVLTRDEWNTTSSPDTFRFTYGASPAIPCGDITSMAARCIGGGVKTIQVRVNLLNSTIHAGETVTITIDEDAYVGTIITNGTHSRANFSISGVYTTGDHVVSLVAPAGCLADKHATCATGDGLEKADPYWDDDAEWSVRAQDAPKATALLGNYPNPFNPSSNIQYALSEDANVTLRVYNMLGQLVATLVDGPQTAGYKSVVWNGTNDVGAGVASGIYIYRMTAGKFAATKRLLLLK